jgi:hypothetical protein
MEAIAIKPRLIRGPRYIVLGFLLWAARDARADRLAAPRSGHWRHDEMLVATPRPLWACREAGGAPDSSPDRHDIILAQLGQRVRVAEIGQDPGQRVEMRYGEVTLHQTNREILILSATRWLNATRQPHVAAAFRGSSISAVSTAKPKPSEPGSAYMGGASRVHAADHALGGQAASDGERRYARIAVSNRVKTARADRGEIAELLKGLSGNGHGLAARFMLLTGARREGVCGAAWVEIKDGVWIINRGTERKSASRFR